MYPLLEQSMTKENFGGKINALVSLSQTAIKIPPGLIIDADEIQSLWREKIDIASLMTAFKAGQLDNIGIQNKIREAVDSILFPEEFIREIYDFFQARKTYIVRSSGLLEDSASYSFAGQYESVLNNRTVDQVLVAIKKCIQSMFSLEVLVYWKEHDFDLENFGMAVLIQEQINADISGIAFSMNPSTGNEDELLIEYVEGLGHLMAEGYQTPYAVKLNWQIPAEYQIYDGKMTLAQIKELKRLIISMVELLGHPIDCEFCLFEDQLYILQVRPITAIPKFVEAGSWTTANFRDGGVASQDCPDLMWSLYEAAWQEALGSYLVDNKFFTEEEIPALSRIKYARPYWNVGMVKEAMVKIPGFQEREFDQELGLQPTYEGAGRVGESSLTSYLKFLPTVWANIRSTRQRLEGAQQLKNNLLEEYTELSLKINAIDSQTPIKEIEELWLHIIKVAYIKSESIYFTQVFINTVQIAIKKDRLLKHMGNKQLLDLLSNIGNLSHTRPYQELKAIADWIKEDASRLESWSQNSIEDLTQELQADPFNPATQKVHAFQEDFGYHSNRELDLREPSYSEDDRIVIKLIKDILNQEESLKVKDSHEERLTLIKSQCPPKLANQIEKDITFLRELLWWREEFKDISSRYYHLIRQISLHLGQVYVKRGVLKDVDDIFHLKFQKIEAFIEGLVGKDELQYKAAYNKAYCSAYRNFKAPDDLVAVDQAPPRIHHKEDSLKGVGASSGLVRAKVRVLKDTDDIWKIEEGEILVTPFTDTGWSTAFPKIAGLVTETGGILSHAAVVAREYGIPIVVNAKLASQQLKTGMTISLDGAQGIITIIDE